MLNEALGASYEVASGRLAERRAASRQTRQFAAQVGRGNAQLTQLMASVLRDSGTPVVIPGALDSRHQTMINDLTMARGSDFDRRYAMQQLAVHQEVVAMLENYAQAGDNPALRKFAQQILPSARTGLRLAQMLPGASGA